MIISTTSHLEGRSVTKYLGIVSGEVISGVNVIKDIAAGITNFFGGRSGSYEKELVEAKNKAIDEMQSVAESLGADAVIGVDIDFEVLGSEGSMLMVVATGTAVRL